jgi:hypothetical protein
MPDNRAATALSMALWADHRHDTMSKYLSTCTPLAAALHAATGRRNSGNRCMMLCALSRGIMSALSAHGAVHRLS